MTPRESEGARPSPDDVEALIERYAGDRLSPDAQQLASGRAAMLAAFAARPPDRALPRPAYRPLLRGWSLAGAFALLLLGAGGIVAAQSGPGQPFYGLRLAIGAVTLPGEERAHERGLAAQLDDRLTEADVAARNGDGRGALAAINEYLHTLAELSRDGIWDPAILDLLQRHQDALEDLLLMAPAQATGGLQESLDAAGHASEVVPFTESADPHPTPPQNGGGSPPATGKP